MPQSTHPLCRYIILVITLFAISFNVKAQTETLPTGSFIINMGATNPNTVANGLKPYGMIYDLMKNNKVPIKWIISPTKLKDGEDFNYNGVSYKGGTFIIPAEQRNAAVNAKITSWQAQGVVGITTTSPLTLNVTRTLTAVPRWTLDATNGAIAQSYLTNAGVPTTAYNWKAVAALDCCDDFYVMPHADPTWATHNRLFTWNKDCLGSIWAACHAVSALENSINPANATQQMNFLSTRTAVIAPTPWPNNSLKLWTTHSGGTVAYTHQMPSDQVAQYMGTTDAAQLNGSEQIYIPKQSTDLGGATRWRPGATIIAYDPTQADVPLPNLAAGNVAALMVYGRGFDDPTRGFVMYEAGHSHNKATVGDVAAQRAFLNFSFFQVQPKAPQLTFSGITGGQTIAGNTTITGINVGASSPLAGITFTYQWSSSCGGVFSNATGTTTNFTAPTVGSTTSCVLSCVVTDNCGRSSFQSFPVTILGATPPTITNDAQSIDPGCGSAIVTKNVLANDVEPDGQPMTLTQINGNTGAFTTANGGLVSFTSNGSVTYTSALGYVGADILTYRVCDNSSPTPLCSNGTYTITIGNIANVPNAVNDATTIAEDAILSNFNVLANDLPLVSGPITVSGIAIPPANGKVSINTDNTITYVPNADFAGTDVITYRIVNALGYSKTATLTITVTNDACDGNQIQITPGSSGTYSQIPNIDAYLNENQTGRNYGSCTVISVNARNGRINRGLARFDVSSIPVGATITNTNLRMQATAVNSNTAINISLHSVTATSIWAEGTQCDANGVSNWNIRTGATNWTAAGGDFAATALANTSVTGTGTYNWTSAAMNTTISNWIANASNNQGLLLKFTSETPAVDEIKTFGSRTNGTVANQPLLTFDWNVPGTCGPIPARVPLAMPDTVTTNSSTVLTFPVTTNDALFGQAVTSLTISTAPSNGTAIVVGNNIQYTPSGTFNGVATLQYTVTTANGNDVVKVYINVTGTPVNAIDDAPAGALSGTVQTINVKANDIDPEGTATSTVAITTAPKNGAASVNGAGQVVYVPNAGFTGNDTLFYSICEPAPTCGIAYCDTARVVMVVQNRAPFANNDTKTATPCLPNTFNLISNDTDAENNNLSVNVVSMAPVDLSTVVANPDGTITFTPQAGAAPTYTVTYNVTDNGVTPQVSNNATVTITVPVFANNAPIAVDDYADTTGMDEILFYNVKDNDSDPDGHLLSNPTITINPLHGTAIVLVSGAIQYTSNLGFAGADTLTYQLCDQPTNPATCAPLAPLCTTAKMFIFIKAPNTVVAINDENSTWMNTPVTGGVMGNDFDPEGDTKIFTGFVDGASAVTSGSIAVNGVDTLGNTVAAGTLAINADGTYTLTPANNFAGTVTVPNTISDNQTNNAVDTALLVITVAPYASMNNSVIANNDEKSTLMNTVVNSTLFANDTDPQSNTFSVSAFKYDSDGDGFAESTGTVGNTTIVAGITTTGVPVINAGSLTINADGTYTFTPTNDFTGVIESPYTITDQFVAASSAILRITILPDLNGALNNPPVPADDFAYTNANTPVTSSFVSNDNDLNGNPVSLNGTTIVTGGAHTLIPSSTFTTAKGGTIQFYTDGTYTYTPPAGYTGPDSVGYQICDVTAINPQPLCTNAFIHLLVGAANTTDAVNNENSTWKDVNVGGNILTNDFDLDNHTQTFGSFLNQSTGLPIATGTTVSGTDKTGAPIANAGLITFAANGTYTFDPDPDFTGTVTVPYNVCDNGNAPKCDTAFLTITVDSLPNTGANMVIANNDENISYGAPVNNNLFVNDRDPQNNTFTVTTITGGTVGTAFTIAGKDQNGNTVSNTGTLLVNADGTYTYTAATGFTGSINVPYIITDAFGATSTAVLHIEVITDPNGTQNNAPFAADDFGYTTINKPVDGNFTGNDRDPNGNPLSYLGVTIIPGGPQTPIGVPVATAMGGTIQFYADGTYTYTPPAGYVGPDKVNYTICDVTAVAPQPLCTEAQIHLLVGPGISIAGKVWDDANGDVIDAGATEPETNAGGTIYVNLVNDLGNVVATTPVAADGSYNFSNVTPGVNYTLQLTTNQGTVGNPAPAVALPDGWANTGENRNGTTDAGTLGVIDTRNYGFTNTVNFDFGIEQLPNTDNHTTNIPQPIVGTTVTLNGGANPPALSGIDPEDCNAGCSLASKSVIIDAVPANSELYYNGVLVTNGQLINNFDPALLEIRMTAATIGSTSTSFQYSYVDLAGKKDPTPATYTLTWLTPLPVILSSFTGIPNKCEAVLQWKTAQEINSEKFVIEQSSNGLNFNPIADVKAANSASGKSYQAIISQPSSIMYYRLKLVDKDGNFTYSSIITLRTSCNNPAYLSVYPNPVTTNITVSFYTEFKGPVNLVIANAVGQHLTSKKIMLTSSANILNLDMTHYFPGIYTLYLMDDKGIKVAEAQKVIKK